MNKVDFIQEVLQALSVELETIVQAANEARSTATHSEAKAENKYDTFGLEAAYLAEGLSRRVADLQSALQLLARITLNDFSGRPIALGALVILESEDSGQQDGYFLSPCQGGASVVWANRTWRLVTPQTPLGRQLLGKEVDDSIELTVHGRGVRYHIVSVS